MTTKLTPENAELMKQKNITTLRRLNKFYLPSNVLGSPVSREQFASFLGNLYSYGFALDSASVKELAYHGASVEELNVLTEAVKDRVGAGISKVSPMYPNFPAQVADADTAELMINALLHYVGDVIGVRIMPDYEKLPREIFTDNVELTVIGLADRIEVLKLAEDIVLSSRPYSEVDLVDLDALSGEVKSTFRGKSVNIAVKENIATAKKKFDVLDFSASFKTVTDVLRLGVAYSDGDVSLGSNTKFKLSRPQRRELLGYIQGIIVNNADRVDDVLGDAVQHREKVKRFAHALHHRDYINQYPLASVFLSDVQAGHGVTFNSIVEKYISAGNIVGIVELLSGHPGVFARRLNELLNKFITDRDYIVAAFKNVSVKVSPVVLVQAWQHFASADSSELDMRITTLKSGKSIALANRLSPDTTGLNYADVLDAIEYGIKRNTRTSELRNKKVFIANSVESSDIATVVNGSAKASTVEGGNLYSMPISVRGVSESDRVIGRGSRIKIDDDRNVIRVFQHWKDIETDGYDSRVDLDLSVKFANEDFTQINDVWYGNLRSGSGSEAVSVHSGDITSAPNGAAEFVDVRIDKMLAKGYRYILPSVLSYSRQKFADIPEAFAGVMFRDDLGTSGEAFEASSVETKYELNADSTNSVPYAFDLKTRELIWLDSTFSTHLNLNSVGVNNVITQHNALLSLLKNVVNTTYYSAVDYIVDTVGSANIVSNEAEADIVLHVDRAQEVLRFA